MSGDTKQVLYVDDEAQALKLFSKLFGNRFSVATAGSVDEAMTYLAEHADEVGVLLTDQRMPGKVGTNLLEHCRHRYPNIVRVLTTAYSDLEAAVKAVNEGGAFRYLTKPWDEDDLVGTLRRAFDYHQALDDRDRLFKEKLSVLHRLIIMDRVRGLATAATALEGRIHNAWEALVDYMQQSPVQQRIRVQMNEIAHLNMLGIARREAEMMVKSVLTLLEDVVAPATGVLPGQSLGGIVQQFIAAEHEKFSADDVALRTGEIADCSFETDPGLLRRLLQILVRRLSDMQELQLVVTISAAAANEKVVLRVAGDFSGMTSGHFNSLFSAAVPLQHWPMGLDMDLLSAFMIAHHLGGKLTIHPNPPEGPGFVVELPFKQPTRIPKVPNPEWFDTVYDSIHAWEEDAFKGLD
jgi:two-component system, probable response regulator PhcQ